MNGKEEKIRAYTEEMTAIRRNLHQYPELGWCEFRTASLVAFRLRGLGYEVITGRAVTPPSLRMGVPSEEVLKQAYAEAVRDGAVAEELLPMNGGFTGVAGILKNGDGPVLALRFDMDALPIHEADCGQPYRSVRPGRMHACGHDAHTAMGLTAARILAECRDLWHGTVKFLFQPAEEGSRGARPLAGSGLLEDVDAILGCHIFGREGRREPQADVLPGAVGSLATTKLDVTFFGRSSHAGSFPEKGHNAILAMAAAITNLHAIPRHSEGNSRVNVGRVEADGGRNIIADHAFMELEVRGINSRVNRFMEEYARRVIDGAAAMHGCTSRIETVGSSSSVESTDALSEMVRRGSLAMGLTPTSYLHEHSEGSEDCSYLMDEVKAHGGEAAFVIFLNDTKGPGHSPTFDIDESVMPRGVSALLGTVLVYMGEDQSSS